MSKPKCQCQTTGHDLMSCLCQPVTNGRNLVSYHCQPLDMISWTLAINESIPNHKDTRYLLINAKPMGMISACMFQQEPNYSLTAIKSEPVYQLYISRC